jgi:hypothetical protein
MSSNHTGGWMKLNCGDPVCRKDDPRHTGSAQPSTVELEHSVGLAQVVPLPFSIPHSLA